MLENHIIKEDNFKILKPRPKLSITQQSNIQVIKVPKTEAFKDLQMFEYIKLLRPKE